MGTITEVESQDSSHNSMQPAQSGYWREASVLVVEGASAPEFLQGYLTCDTLTLQTNIAQPAAICNVKGRVLANGWALLMKEAVGLVVHHSLLTAVREFLKPYVTFSKCNFRDEPAFIKVNTADATIRLFDDVDLELAELEPSELDDVSAFMTRRLVRAEYAFVSEPVSAEFLPQMLALDAVGAVDFNKGCYLGQEIVARAQFRGAVKRRLQPFAWTGTAPDIGSVTDARETIITVSDDGKGLRVARAAAE